MRSAPKALRPEWQRTIRLVSSRSFAKLVAPSFDKGKGDHEIWHSPINGRRFMVDNKIKSRKWANITLKNAGIPKAL